MIQSLSGEYSKAAAWLLFMLFYMESFSPLFAHSRVFQPSEFLYQSNVRDYNKRTILSDEIKNAEFPHLTGNNQTGSSSKMIAIKKGAHHLSPVKLNIGGLSSPEATSFKAVGSDNLVNLFTGDFSYSIPLLDVGGYPVNLFYSGGVTMDQEASWVGLGWNINPGTVSRNMRGVPDDFNGTDLLIQSQNVKPNRTWGGELGVDGEVIGIKKPNLGLSLGFSYNNYLGPALDMGATLSLSIATIENIKYEKSATSDLGLSAAIGLKLGSRSGLTFSPSLNANTKLNGEHINTGIGLNTSYNSRTGIRDLTISSQTTLAKNGNLGNGLLSGLADKIKLGKTISFARPSYMPSLRIPMENSNTSGQLELGAGLFGLRGAVTGNGYYSESRVAPESRVITKPLVGFMYSEKAAGNKDAVMDFTRLNDGEVTPNTPIISAPQYAYDIFSIQGEGTGGSIRAYRGDLGFMRDNVTTSKDKNISLGADIAPPGHFGGNWNIISSPTRVGGWEDANNTLLRTLAFKPSDSVSRFENVYFRNPGEATVTSEEVINRIGGDNLVKFKLSGSNVSPRLESGLEMFNKKTGSSKGYLAFANNNNLQNREKRTQVTTMLTAKEASQVGLDKYIRSYTGGFSVVDNTILYDSFPRVSSYRKAHHISEIDVLEQNGMRYVYGIPVYSVTQKDFTFSVENIPANQAENLVSYDTTQESTVNSKHMANSSKIDGYVQIQETPAYASSFLLTGLLSSDYVDVTANGITEDDLGNAVKFNYTQSTDLHKWRTPRKNVSNGTKDLAHFNEGIRTEKRDNKATISYGERESWYLNSIESKSMVAIFKTDVRNDAKGVKSPLNGFFNAAENANKKLSRIDLYTKAEIKAKGINNAVPVKSVFFIYDYSLCKGTPDNSPGGGKLTLKSVSFSYNGQSRQVKDKYVFGYNDTSAIQNPSYAYNSSDKWGTYKNPSINHSQLTNIDYPFTDTSKTDDDFFAGAWSLKKILLPSGGQMEIQYEADDYAYVQDRRACNMFSIYGLGSSTTFSTNNSMYTGSNSALDNYYVYIKLPKSLENTDPIKRKQEIFTKYLEGIKQLAFKLLVEMPNGPEPLTVYANYDDYGFCSNTGNTDIIYLKLRSVDGKSPLAKSAIGFLTGNLPGQAFPGYEAEVNTLPDFVNLAVDMLANLKNAFKNVDDQMRSSPKARTIVLGSSFVRLDNPSRMKYGGGVRVKKVLLRDNWNKMTGQYDSYYGQDYDYTTTEKADGKDITISSGVASYEPGIGSEENPFREIVSFNNKLPLASAQYGAIEMPMLEGLYPSPSVGYGKITVRSIHRKGTHGDSTLRSAIGKQVTQFYTAKEYPSFSAYTPMTSVEYNKNPFFSFLYKEIINRRTVSQGFLVETNDMHGKMKSQAAYSESDEKTPVSASYYTYKNTGKNGLNDKIDFVYNDQGNTVKKGNIGVDMELMTDVREFRLQSDGINGQLQTDLFPFAFIVIPIFTMFPLKTYQENLYRAVTCTKLINYHAIEDSVIVMDKGSVVSTKTIAYDAETGSAIVTQTANEFNDPVYNVSYPAYWAYSGTGQAYKNIGMNFKGVNFYDGKIISGVSDMTFFESGDELYINNPGSGTSGCIPASQDVFRLWAYDKNKNTTALTVPVKDLVFMDSVGRLFTKNGVGFKIIRSGRRNNLGLTISGATCMKNPVQNNKLVIDNASNVVAASAIEYKEKWQVDNDVILRKTYYTDPCTSVESESIDCSGILEKKINPYVKGLIGNLRPYRNYTYYGSRNDSDVNVITAIRKNGYLYNFSNFWGINAANNFVPDYTNPKWVWNSELTRINAKGQELETKDALNRYTSAQYGFNKNMPVAIVQNAPYGEAFNEGFEDYNYAEMINKINANICDTRYINFIEVGNSKIVNTDTMSLMAHSGKKILQINANSLAIKSIKIEPSLNYNYTLENKQDTTFTLNQTGVNFDSLEIIESGVTYSQSNQTSSNSQLINGFSYDIVQGPPPPTDPPQITPYEADAPMSYVNNLSFYLDIPQNNTYDIYTSYVSTAQYYLGLNEFSLEFQITSLEGELLANSQGFNAISLPVPDSTVGKHYQLCLSKGIYKVVCKITHLANVVGEVRHDNLFYCYINDQVSFSLNNSLPGYKSLTKENGCIFSKPIAAKDSMLNNDFSFPLNKRMLLSAWVKEDCGNPAGTPCYQTNYSKSSINVKCNGNSVGLLKPSGVIIEGWQKIEGEFIVPVNTTTAQLEFANTNNKPMYVDDIRIHPFNSNMKSYVYDPVTLRLSAELDENNFSTFYEYDEEGQLVRIKKETIEGIKTIKESRSAKQKSVTDLQ